eukprot:1148904-Pelagomonas_calceolata.AAC.4
MVGYDLLDSVSFAAWQRCGFVLHHDHGSPQKLLSAGHWHKGAEAKTQSITAPEGRHAVQCAQEEAKGVECGDEWPKVARYNCDAQRR